MNISATVPTTLKALSKLIEGTGYRLLLNGKCPNNYRLQVARSKDEWENCASYRYAEQFFACGLAADYINDAANSCEGEQSQQLYTISTQMRELCGTRMRHEQIGPYAHGITVAMYDGVAGEDQL